MKLNENIIKELLSVPGIPGNEFIVANILKSYIEKNNLKLDYDNLGSIWAIKKSNNPNAKTVMIDSHMDEVGFVVANITERGFIKFSNLGGIWNKSLCNQKVLVWDYDLKKSYNGVIVWPNSNSHKGEGDDLKIEDMLIDIGFSSKKEILDHNINIGSTITFDTSVIFNNKRVISKAVDNRIGVSMVVQLMEYIKDKEYDYNIVLGASVQEEVGLRGARTSSYKWTPDVAFAVDVTFCYHTPGMKQSATKLGSGPALSLFDSYTIANKNLINQVKKVAEDNKISYTVDSMTGGGTDAGAVQLAKDGVKAMTVSIPSRYMHSHNSIIDVNDVSSVAELIIAFAKSFDKKALEEITFK